jgi:transposase
VAPARFPSLGAHADGAGRFVAAARDPGGDARQLGVCHQIVSEVAHGVAAGWSRRVARGRPCRATSQAEPGQVGQGGTRAHRGAQANGYPTELWTLPRVAELIERLTGGRYHPGHVWYVVRDQLGWSCQRPARRAIECDDEAIQHWVRTLWPQVKKERGARAR